MRRTQIGSLLVATVFLAAACTTMMDRPPADPQAVVNERIAVMKGFVGALATSGQYLQGKTTAAAAKTKLAAARQGAGRLENLFPRGTALGDRGVSESRALSTIFANRSDFDDKREALVAALADLDTALGGSKEAAAKAIQSTKDACLACHNRYRAPGD